MKELEINYKIKVYEQTTELDEASLSLVSAAKNAAQNAYTPYSNFNVGCAVQLMNGQVVTGSNQENASFPAGICAERVALSAASSLFPNIAIARMAIAVSARKEAEEKPVAPCGICRQTIFEYEKRFEHEIGILLCSQSELVYEIKSIKELLPLGFSGADLT